MNSHSSATWINTRQMKIYTKIEIGCTCALTIALGCSSFSFEDNTQSMRKIAHEMFIDDERVQSSLLPLASELGNATTKLTVGLKKSLRRISTENFKRWWCICLYWYLWSKEPRILWFVFFVNGDFSSFELGFMSWNQIVFMKILPVE